MKRRSFGLQFALCLSLVGLLVATGGLGSARAQSPTPTPLASPAAKAPGGHAAQQQQQAPSAAPAPAATAAVALTRGPGDFDLTQPDSGLSALAAYRAVLQMQFATTQGGKSTGWTETLTMTVTRKPDARELIKETQNVSGTQVTRLAEIGGQEYDLEPGGKCWVEAMDPASAALPHREPALLLPHILGAELVAASENVGGVPARHYRFDDRAVPFGPGAKAAGEVWVAADGRVQKYSLRADGDETYFGTGVTGWRTWQYDLTELKAPAALQAPAGCGTGGVDAPLPPDAADLAPAPGSVRYTTRLSPKDVAAFYAKQLPPLGWTAGVQQVATEGGQLTFTRGRATARGPARQRA